MDLTIRVEKCRWWPRIQRCQNYGMTLYRTPKCSFRRYSIICHKRFNPRPTEVKMDPKRLNIISYNVHELPHLLKRSGQRERTCRIPEAIMAKIPEADVIIFQELFLGGCLEDHFSIIHLLRAYHFNHIYNPTNSHPSFPRQTGSGLLIASRWPIVSSDYLTFKAVDKLSSDFLSTKGALYTAIQKGRNKFHIFTTHLQAKFKKTRIRLQQARELYEFKVAMRIPQSEPVIYAGDFNEDLHTQRRTVNHMFDKILEASIAEKIGRLHYTYDDRNVFTVHDSQWLDYIAISKVNRRPKKVTMKAVDLRANRYFEYCKFSLIFLKYQPPSSFKCLKRMWTDTLSDHYLLHGVIEM